MSSNAWKVAMQAATEQIERSMDKWGNLDDSGVLDHLPEPPAFRAAVEAEIAAAFEAGVRAGWQSSTEDFNSEMWVGPLSEQRVEDDVVARAIRDRALLSRIGEGKP